MIFYEKSGITGAGSNRVSRTCCLVYLYLHNIIVIGVKIANIDDVVLLFPFYQLGAANLNVLWVDGLIKSLAPFSWETYKNNISHYKSHNQFRYGMPMQDKEDLFKVGKH